MSGEFDAARLSYADIRPHYGTMNSVHVSGSGRNKVHRTRIGVKTKIGDIEEPAWRELAVAVIEAKGDSAEFQKTLDWVRRQKKYNHLKTEAEFLKGALERFIYEKTAPEEWAAIKNRKRVATRGDFETAPDAHSLNWLTATAEVMEDGSEWVAIVTVLGEIQEDLWLALSAQLINEAGCHQMLIDETDRLQESYGKLLANGRVDERFIRVQAVQSVIRSLASGTRRGD